MPGVIINIILAILSITGLIYIYQLISGWLLRSKNVCRQYTILQFDESEEDAEYISVSYKHLAPMRPKFIPPVQQLV